jgi:cysteine desulfuration protein SufE
LVCEERDGKLYFKGTSDAIIVKGLIYIILEIFSGLEKQTLKEVDMDIVYELGLSEVITPNRQSGVIGMIKKIKEYANS